MSQDKTNKVEGVIDALHRFSEMSEYDWLIKYKSLYIKVCRIPRRDAPKILKFVWKNGYNGLVEDSFFFAYKEILDKYLHEWDFDSRVLYISSLKFSDVNIDKIYDEEDEDS